MNLMPLSAYPDVLSTIARWHFDEWGRLYPGETLADFERGLEASMESGAVPGTWLLMDGEEVVATASLLHTDMSSNPDFSPWLANVYVRPDQRGKGLGARVVTEVMHLAHRFGLEALYLFTEDQQAFYQRLGWAVHHREHYHGAEVAVMVHKFQ
ncbi:GNAT family N-acetyltransferase [Marinobacter hydrocarbonoclasticus]|nr:GNAT family N-acetyltransferase [Marinobacter nauticus]